MSTVTVSRTDGDVVVDLVDLVTLGAAHGIHRPARRDSDIGLFARDLTRYWSALVRLGEAEDERP